MSMIFSGMDPYLEDPQIWSGFHQRLIVYLAAIIVLGPLLLAPITYRLLPHSSPPPIGTLNGPSINVSNAMGGSNVNVVIPIPCAGKVPLAQGSATVNDSCFTGDTNIVIWSDVTAVNAVCCAAGTGSLTLEGHDNDTIAYARVK